MGSRLSARLARIRASGGKRPLPPPAALRPTAASLDGWDDLSSFLKRRVLVSPRRFARFDALLPFFGIFCPGSARAFADGPLPASRLRFFDLETTGLSGGAGTVAFLAAFGRLVPAGPSAFELSVVQYLLLDYPGEADFLACLREEFEGGSGGECPVLASYNGRSFDSQIVRTRFLMNAMAPLDPPHLDLVYPARRLWRRSLENCSLGTIERAVLGIERFDDLPGSEAPDAWFGFLRNGSAERLLRVCDHNFSDLEGLAELLVRVDRVSRDPLGALRRSAEDGGPALDAEALALRCLAAAKAERAPRPLARALLEEAFRAGSARAAYALSGEAAAEGDFARAAELRLIAARSEGSGLYPAAAAGLRAAAFRSAAVDARRRLRDPERAVSLVEEGLSLPALPDGARGELERLRAALVPSAEPGLCQ